MNFTSSIPKVNRDTKKANSHVLVAQGKERQFAELKAVGSIPTGDTFAPVV